MTKRCNVALCGRHVRALSDEATFLNLPLNGIVMNDTPPKKIVQRVLEYYSACDFCQRDKTKLCEEKVPENIRQTYFMTIYPRWEDDITKRCKYFRLHKGKFEKLLKEIETEEW